MSAPIVATLRVMTWNIHGGIGPDGRFDLDRIGAVIQRHRPDILGLQELDTRGRDIATLATLHKLASPEGYSAEARTIVAPDGHYGHALFSRWPMSDMAVHDVSALKREPRSAIEVMIASRFGPLHVISAHLGLSLAERRAQARRLAELAGSRKGVATILLGDLNDWSPLGAVRRALARVLPARTSEVTFPARRPVLRLDRIYCCGMTIVAARTDQQARHCSDHLPVIADLQYEAGELADGARTEPLII